MLVVFSAMCSCNSWLPRQGLLVLLVNTTLGLYKPRGLTIYGRRRQEERRIATVKIPQSLRETLQITLRREVVMKARPEAFGVGALAAP